MLINVDMYTKTTSPERALLSQVVLTAINDACIAPNPEFRRKHKSYIHSKTFRMYTNSFTSMRFLFDESVSGLNEFSVWLDFDPGHFRQKLITLMDDQSASTKNGYTPMQRRCFRINYKMWKTLSDTDKAELETNSDLYDDSLPSMDDLIYD
jgi:hypothetical protein